MDTEDKHRIEQESGQVAPQSNPVQLLWMSTSIPEWKWFLLFDGESGMSYPDQDRHFRASSNEAGDSVSLMQVWDIRGMKSSRGPVIILGWSFTLWWSASLISTRLWFVSIDQHWLPFKQKVWLTKFVMALEKGLAMISHCVKLGMISKSPQCPD